MVTDERAPEAQSDALLLTHAETLPRGAKVVVDADREVLPADLVAVVDAMNRHLADIARANQILMHGEVDTPAEVAHFINRRSVASARVFASVLRNYADEIWFSTVYGQFVVD